MILECHQNQTECKNRIVTNGFDERCDEWAKRTRLSWIHPPTFFLFYDPSHVRPYPEDLWDHPFSLSVMRGWGRSSSRQSILHIISPPNHVPRENSITMPSCCANYVSSLATSSFTTDLSDSKHYSRVDRNPAIYKTLRSTNGHTKVPTTTSIPAGNDSILIKPGRKRTYGPLSTPNHVKVQHNQTRSYVWALKLYSLS